jgi:hypothetical protein
MRLVQPAGILVLLAATNTARATPSARLVYARSPEAASCPDEATLRKAVAARFGYDPFFPWANQTVVVQISGDAGHLLARVQLVDDQGIARGTREIASEGDACSDLFDAAALAISIALDASAAVTAKAAAAELEAEAPAAPADVSAPIEPAPTPVPLAREAPVERPPPPPSPWHAGLDATALALVTPNVLPGLAAFGEYRARSLSFGVEMQGSATKASLDLSERSPSSAGLTAYLLAIALVPCAHFGRAFACAVVDLGWLHAWASGLTHPRSDDAPFVAAGGRVGVEWPLSGRLVVRLHADLVADLTPPRFVLDGQSWAASAGAGSFGVGVGAPWP